MALVSLVRGRHLPRQSTNVFLRNLSNRGACNSCLSHVTKKNVAWSQNEPRTGDTWWSSSLALPAAFIMLGAGTVSSCLEFGDGYQRNDHNFLWKPSSVMSTEMSPHGETMKKKEEELETDDDTTDVVNWSGTHQVNVSNKNYWEPESIEEVEKIVKDCQERGQTVRPLGSSLSPNGVALNKDGMISMANLDKVLEVNTENKTITVEAGIPVREVRKIPRTEFLHLIAFETFDCQLKSKHIAKILPIVRSL